MGAGQPVTLGIRPEHVALSDSTENLADPTEPFEATVDVVEPVGDEVFVYLLLEAAGASGMDEEELLMAAKPGPALTDHAEGETFRLRMDRSCIHLFDAETGEAILHGIEDTPTSEPELEEARSD